MTSTNLLTPKEINIIMRKMVDDIFEYDTFKELLFETRFELAKSRVMDTNNDQMADHLKYEFAAKDTEKTGKIYILDIQDVLMKSKKTTLTPMQVYTLIGYSEPDDSGMVDYEKFSEVCTLMINDRFSVKSLSEKAFILQNASYKPSPHVDSVPLTELELFQIFKKYDRNQNGFLEIMEYVQCLRASATELSDPEIIAVSLASDINADGRIDYEEFMKHFIDMLRMVRTFQELQEEQVKMQQDSKLVKPSAPSIAAPGTIPSVGSST